MIAYNTQWLDALSVKAQAGKWFKKGWISAGQWQYIQHTFTSTFYSPNFFVRVGLFIFTWILVTSIFGLFGVAIMEEFNSEAGAGMVCLFYSGILIFGLEYFIKEKKYYRAGIDDALLYMALGLAVTGICLITEPVLKNHLFFYFLLSFPLVMAATIRYVDALAAFASYACLVAMMFLALENFQFTRMIIPFACMAFSGLTYFIMQKNKKRKELHYWADCLQVVEACSLILFYFSGNYFIVKELGELLFPGYTLPFSFLFFVLTAIIPLIYVYFGLKNFDRLMLRLGLLMIALSVITFKYYFSLGHYEITLTVAGAIMIGIAYTCIQYLKKKPTSFTYQEDTTDETPSFSNAEGLLVAQTFGPSPVGEKGFDFGNGRFGGGGAGGNY
jgi:uncharacterized membrane protein (DUF485 family)